MSMIHSVAGSQRSSSRWLAVATGALSAVLLWMALGSVAWAAPQPRIVGGVEATREYAHQARLSIDVGGGSALCGGSLITPTVVLTAAHCVTDDNGDALTVGNTVARVGGTNLAPAIDAQSYVVHPQYDAASYRNDVALIRLASASAKPTIGIVGAGEESLWDAGTDVTVIGWGTTSAGGSISNTLKEVTIPVVDAATCGSDQSYGSAFDPSVMMCAGLAEGGKDSCQGDSGGPLLSPYGAGHKVVGIVSWGEGCADPDKYGVYTRIGMGALRRWIVDNALTGSEPVGLQNASFEADLAGWDAQRLPENGDAEPATCPEPNDGRGICVIDGPDTFTADGSTRSVHPVDGTKMVRLGGPFTSSGEGQLRDRYILRQTFRVDPSNSALQVNYNVFTFDYAGFDELRIRISVTDEEGQSIYSKVQGGYGSGVALKNTGWQGNTIDLSGYEGQVVHLKVDSGGTLDHLYGFWAYLDAGVVPAPPVGDPQTGAPAATPDGDPVTVNTYQDPDTGQTFFTIPNSTVNAFAQAEEPVNCGPNNAQIGMPLTMSVPIAAGGGTITNAELVLLGGSGTQRVGLEDPDGDGVLTIVAGSSLCAATGDLLVEYDLTEDGTTHHFVVPLGGITLIDPQGVVYEREKFDAKLAELGADPQCAEKVDDEDTASQAELDAAANCAAKKTQARAFAAIEGATVRLQRKNADTGEFQNVLSGDPGISPNINPQTTGTNGLYQWDVSAGEYRVVVTRSGFVSVTSQAVTIPPPVLDLHIPMERVKPPAQPSQPSKPSQPSQPSQSEQPTQSFQPILPSKPAAATYSVSSGTPPKPAACAGLKGTKRAACLRREAVKKALAKCKAQKNKAKSRKLKGKSKKLQAKKYAACVKKAKALGQTKKTKKKNRKSRR